MPRFIPLPGEYLADELEYRKISQRQFAKIIGKTPTEVNDIIKGRKSINADFAMRFSAAFGTTPELWLNLQNAYDIYQLRKLKEKKTAFAAIKKRSLVFA
ncbi:HigA family addiction module antidote protein [Patescibacteria group bacterium]|nr:HigA family addiction module antidote protein [Patescibacteria group bacterium]